MAFLLKFESECTDNQIIIFLDMNEKILFQNICEFIDVYFLVFFEKYEITFSKEIAIQTYEDCKLLDPKNKEKFMIELNKYNDLIKDPDSTTEQKIAKIIEQRLNKINGLETEGLRRIDWQTGIFEKIRKYKCMENYVIIEEYYCDYKHYIIGWDYNKEEFFNAEYYYTGLSGKGICDFHPLYIEGERNAIIEKLNSTNKYQTILQLITIASRDTKITIAPKSEFE
jgi:hypothetical protein